MLVQVRNPENYALVTEWDDADEKCDGFGGYNGYCGGCVRCMEMQAHHSGLLIERPEEYKWFRRFRWRIRNFFEHLVPRLRYLWYRYGSRSGCRK